MQTTTVNLAGHEIMLAAVAGAMRQIENIKRNREPAYGAGVSNDWQLHIEGVLGEYALAKYLGVRWDGKGKLRAPDVGEVDCRTRSRAGYDMIIHPEDPDDRVFWLVLGNNGHYRVAGWILGRDGKRQEWWKDPTGKGRHAYFVPQSALNSPESWWAR